MPYSKKVMKRFKVVRKVREEYFIDAHSAHHAKIKVQGALDQGVIEPTTRKPLLYLTAYSYGSAEEK